MTRMMGFLLLLTGSAAVALAGNVQSPEIDANAGAAAVTLLSGALLVLRARRKK